MTNAKNLPAIDPQIADNAAALIDAAVAIGSAYDLVAMRDQAYEAVKAAKALAEALEIETQGGRAALECGYRPADRPSVLAAVRRHLMRAVMDRLTWRDDAGNLHMLWSTR
ncbi:hypothetical protein [Nocardia paucivorans]|uniref:hypothetical protein n=1 Tax=Nocardia paucivorans TaxID=114259 RepID=UPI0002F99996|nr:hypothetical protein [Nocardia paucivorans]